MKVACRNKIWVAALAAARSVMPGATFLLMVPATLTKFAVARVTFTKRSFQMPVTALGELILYLVQLIHFLRVSIARSFVIVAIFTILVDATLDASFLTRGGRAVLRGAATNLMTNTVKLSLIHRVFMFLLGRAGQSTGKL